MSDVVMDHEMNVWWVASDRSVVKNGLVVRGELGNETPIPDYVLARLFHSQNVIHLEF